MTLARLHAVLDSVVEAQELIAMIDTTSQVPSRATNRVNELFEEAREVLRALLTRPAERQTVGTLISAMP